MDLNLNELVERVRRHIGRKGPPYVKTIEKGALLKFCSAVGETNPLYVDEDYARTTVYGGLIAPPTYLSVFSEACAGTLEKDLPFTRFLHTDDVIESYLPIRVGDVITAQGVLADVFAKSGRRGPLLFQAVDITLTNQRDERVAKVTVLTAHHQ
jgi:acyl dehydratase